LCLSGAHMVKSSLNQDLVAAGRACGEIAGILNVGYLQAAHQRRQRIREAAASAQLDGRETTPERLYSWLSNIPLTAYGNLGGEAYAAEIFQALQTPRNSDLAQEAGGLAEQAKVQAGGDPIEGAAVLFRGRDRVHAASRLAYSLYLRTIFGSAEPAVSDASAGLQTAAHLPRAQFDVRMGRVLARSCGQASAAAAALLKSVAIVQRALAGDRRTSRIHAVADLLFAGHPLAQAEAARLFGISRLAARTHLLRLAKLGLVEVATRRKYGQIFVARDGIMTFALPTHPQDVATANKVPGRLKVTVPAPMTAEERSRLDAATEEVALLMGEMDQLLARFKARPSEDKAVSRG